MGLVVQDRRHHKVKVAPRDSSDSTSQSSHEYPEALQQEECRPRQDVDSFCWSVRRGGWRPGTLLHGRMGGGTYSQIHPSLQHQVRTEAQGNVNYLPLLGQATYYMLLLVYKYYTPLRLLIFSLEKNRQEFIL